MRSKIVEIDGAVGGGSVLRIGVGLAAALGIPTRIVNIRKSRPKPGLKAQHLAGLLAVAEVCDAELKGAELGSQEIEFHPGRISKEKISINIETAGSVGLALQPLQITCLATNHPVRIFIAGGGTFGKWAPPLPYLKHVNFPILEKFGYRAKVKVDREGFYPKGGARAEAVFYPPKIEGAMDFSSRGRLMRIEGLSIASHHLKQAKVAERQADSAREFIKTSYPQVKLSIKAEYCDTRSPGSGVVLAAIHEETVTGADGLGERGKRAEVVGKEAAEDLLRELESQATLDRYMADQVVPFLGLFGGQFRFRELTEHMQTNIEVVSQFTDKRFSMKQGMLSAD